MKKTVLQRYAHLIAKTGVNVQPGQEVVVRAGLDQPEFVQMVVEECYKLGASLVTVDWEYQPLAKTRYRYAKTNVLAKVEEWELAKIKHRVETLPAMIYLESEDPDGLAGMNQKKFAAVQQKRYPILKPFRDEMENKYQWCIAAVPGKKWAKKVFPELRVSAAVEKLWEMILMTSRADGEDPVAAWDAHNADLAARCEYLNNLHPVELRYHSKNGTDFTVGLIPEGQFEGGSAKTLSGTVYNPNIPSEEAFTSPMKGKAEGTVVATRPLSYQGQLIENFSLTFHEGKVVSLQAEKNQALLEKMVAMDENSCYLGECALVPYDSPIRNSEVTFLNTLFDENACCHLALGMGFAECIRGYETKTLEECRALGVNDSIIHVDFMIGSEDLSIDAVDAEGKLHPIFRDGNWAF
ncbi:MAG: aminopeptidase [Eubacteriales bacterium]|nr:aminopeptidase [Clostridiales bacterium]MDD7774990.1 aminopeptidase [Eubacteriales bacterium]MDY3940417.1 aminopeptidase [Eubacteriales bacterium]